MLAIPVHPLTLSFRDPALERAWWEYFARTRAAHVRGASVLLVMTLIAFGVVDRFAYPDFALQLFTIRMANLALVFPAVAWLLQASPAQLGRHAQGAMFWLALVTFSGLAFMGQTVRSVATDADIRLAIWIVIFCLTALYTISGLRFAWASLIGVGTVGLFFATFAADRAVDAGVWVVPAVFALVVTFVGLFTCWSIEYYGRRDFARERELDAERHRAEELLRNIVPDAFAARLERQQGPILERLPDVTVLFATIVGFEEATRDLPPLESVALLDRLVARFDELALDCGVERIKTVGATYMAAAGLPDPREDHAEAAARLALAMRDEVERIAEGRRIGVRIGMASGPVMAGVIGRTRYAFDCWGDTANIASRLDSHGEPGRVHVDQRAAARLESAFILAFRGVIPMKGKGDQTTYWLEAAR